MYRGTGRTTKFVEECLKEDGIYIVATGAEQLKLKQKYPELDVRILNDKSVIGEHKKCFLDHYVLQFALEKEIYHKIDWEMYENV